MLDKKLIENKFKNSIESYDENAIIQEIMASKLVSLIDKHYYKNILEIGSYSGILTKKIVDNFVFDNYLALDIVDSFSKIEKLSPKISFQKIDVEEFTTDKKFDLIVANASLQWCNDFGGAIKKLKSYLTIDGKIALTTFTTDNFYEIRDSFNITLNYKTIEELESLFSSSATIIQEIHTLQFNSPNELLKHLKLTGVNAISSKKLPISVMKEKLNILDKKYQNKLTYKPVYIID